MPWFTAVLVRAAHVDGTPPASARLGDLLYKLIQAPDAEAAYARALELGESATEPYVDEDGVAITFRFLGLAGLEQLPGPPQDGMVVYTQLVPGAPASLVVGRDELAVFQPEEDQGTESFDGGGAPLRPR